MVADSPPADTEPCERCGASIDPTVRECPECGSNPAKAARRSAYILLGVGVCLPVFGLLGVLIGAVFVLVGITVLVVLWRDMADYSPTSRDFEVPFESS